MVLFLLALSLLKSLGEVHGGKMSLQCQMLCPTEGWLGALWGWGIHVLNQKDSQPAVVLSSTLVLFLPKEQEKPIPVIFTLKRVHHFSFKKRLKATHPSSWLHWTQMVQPWYIFLQHRSVDTSTSLSKGQWQGNNQNSDSLNNLELQTTVDEVYFLQQLPCLSLPSASL